MLRGENEKHVCALLCLEPGEKGLGLAFKKKKRGCE